METKETKIKKGFKRGAGTTQKMFSFRLDLDLINEFELVRNKGRLINELLRDFFQSKNHPVDDVSSSQDVDDYLP